MATLVDQLDELSAASVVSIAIQLTDSKGKNSIITKIDEAFELIQIAEKKISDAKKKAKRRH